MVEGGPDLAVQYSPEGRLAPLSQPLSNAEACTPRSERKRPAHTWPPRYWVALGQSLPLSGPRCPVGKKAGGVDFSAPFPLRSDRPSSLFIFGQRGV